MFGYTKENELHRYIVDNFNNFYDYEYIDSEIYITGGLKSKKIDILAKDKDVYYIIELKRDFVNQATINQLSGYIKEMSALHPDKTFRGIASAPKKEKVKYIPTGIEVKLLDTVEYTNVCTGVSLPKSIVSKIRMDAKKNHRTFNNEIAKIILDYYNK